MKTRSFILIAAASASAHASFLGDLATNAKRVGSSPYATGGDIILCLDSSANEYAHVFTNTAPKTYGSFTSATFTPAQAMTTRILLIGGGGGGGGANNTNPGGGGGGGFVETNNVQLSASAYTVKIASGGTSGNGSSGGNGGPSSFAVGEGDTISAYGGGGGGKAADGLNGATGGGGGINLTHATLLNPQTLGYVFGTTYYYRLECENVDGALTNSYFTDVASFALADNATYTWKVGDGHWNDADSWTCSVADSYANGYSIGYPVYGATAKFADNLCATVRVSRAERCMKLDLNSNNMRLTILGTGDDAKVVPNDAGTSQTSYGTGSTYVFDHVTTWAPFWATLTVAANVRVVAQNGAVHTISRYGSSWEYVTMTANSGSSFEAYSGGKIESGSMRAARGNKLVADGGTLKVNSDMFLAYVSGQTAGKIIVGADLSRVEVPGQFTAANAPAAIEFRIPRDGYSSVPVYGNNSQAFAASGNTITLGASKTLSEIRRNSKNIEMRLVYWQKGITYANVRFGETVTSAGMCSFSRTPPARSTSATETAMSSRNPTARPARPS